jgi:hypothetical protein
MGDWCGSANDREPKTEKNRVWRGTQKKPNWRQHVTLQKTSVF